MNKSYFLKKKLAELLRSIALSVFVGVKRFLKLAFRKRTVLFVTNEKIRSITVGPISQACLFLFFAWVGDLFIQSLRYDEVISAKSSEISRLQDVNGYFKDEFESVSAKLKKINEYLSSINGETNAVKVSDFDLIQPKSHKEEEFSDDDKETMSHIKETNLQLTNVHLIAKERIKKIEGAISITGLNLRKNLPQTLQKKLKSEVKEISLNDKKGISDRQGGPAEERLLDDVSDSKLSDEDDLDRHLEKVKFTSEIDYLMVLERLVSVMPLSRPMKNYYISSGFGHRVDPLTGKMAAHQGLDFVGSYHEKIISPSEGRVVLAGKFSDYGNAVVIDHGFGITTRYGHLSEVKVKEGQRVKKGEVIALQGSTGRSTGPHLHYEVRYRNTPLNPRKFLEAGQNLFNSENPLSHANS